MVDEVTDPNLEKYNVENILVSIVEESKKLIKKQHFKGWMTHTSRKKAHV